MNSERDHEGNGSNGNGSHHAAPVSAAREILIYERHVNEALRRLHRRTGYEPATDHTPLHALFESESGDLDEWAIRTDTVRRMFAYLVADGPHPAQILRRIFAIGSHMGFDPFVQMTLREKAQMLGDSHGAQHWRLARICTDPLLRKGARSVKAPGQKGIHASAAAAAAQQGNQNRARHGNGNVVVGSKKKKPKKIA